MATSLSAEIAFPTDPHGAWALLSDHGYVSAVASATGGHDVDVRVTPHDDGGATIVSRRTLPAAVPSYARPLVGDHLLIDEKRVLGPAEADGTRHGTVDVGFGGAPMAVTGSLRLRPSDAGSVLEVHMTLKASVPFVGGKVEGFAGEQVGRFLHKEEQVAADRLAGSAD